MLFKFKTVPCDVQENDETKLSVKRNLEEEQALAAAWWYRWKPRLTELT